VIAGTRLRGGNAASARGAASLAAQAIGTARACGCTGQIIVRLDSAFCNAAVIGAIRGQGARFSVTVPMNSSIRAAIAAIPEDAWTPIRYPRAIWDDQLDCWISDAEVAETGYTAFASEKGQAVTARLIVRRVRDLNKQAADGQDELFPVWRWHAVFTDSPFELVISRPRGSTAATPSWSRSSPTRLSPQSSQSWRSAADWCSHWSRRAPSGQREPRPSSGAIWAAITRQGIVSPRGNSRAAAWPRRRRRTSGRGYPSRRYGHRVR